MYKAVKILVSVVFLFFALFFLADQLRESFSYERPQIDDYLILEEVNQRRTLVEASELSMSKELITVAEKKLEDMFYQNYFEHTSPDGKDVDHLAKEVGYEFILIGENLLQGRFDNEEDVVQAWMDSPGHRENILNERYMETGIASRYGDFLGKELFMSVQVFAVPLDTCPEVDDALLKRIENKEDLIDDLRSRMENEDNITRYNNLVDQYNDTVSRITAVIEEYNAQIEAKKNCFSQFR